MKIENGGPSPEEMGLNNLEENEDEEVQKFAEECGLTLEQARLALGKLTEFPDLALPIAERQESETEIAELETMLEAFEAKHSLEELSLLTGFKTNEEARAHPVREPARLDLIPITEKINVLKNETNISKEQYDELNKVYQKLYNAVGTIQHGIFTHDIVRK